MLHIFINERVVKNLGSSEALPFNVLEPGVLFLAALWCGVHMLTLFTSISETCAICLAMPRRFTGVYPSSFAHFSHEVFFIAQTSL